MKMKRAVHSLAVALMVLIAGVMPIRGVTQAALSDLDALRYIASHPDLIEALGADPAKGRTHYETWGIKEGRRITFDPLTYTASHPDLIVAYGLNMEAVTRNYILFGYAEGRRTTFDGLAYIASHGDLIEAFGANVMAGVRHYIMWGFNEGRRITFNALAYIASHFDLIAAFGADAIAGATHYINWGYREGRRIVFDAVSYLANQPDLRAAFGNDTTAAAQHFIRYGFTEGRSYARDGSSPTSRMEAHRFLVQATFGPTDGEIKRLLEFGYSANGYERWIDAQIAKPVSLQLPATIAFVPDPRPMDFGPDRPHQARVETWFKNALQGEDQLRQRMAWALSQIMVVSGTNALLFLPFATADFYDMLARNAFGNYRKLLEDVTLHPAMGVYLSMLGNQKAVEGTNIRPDENYAREMMQLFSIGLVQLNIDGSVRLDAQGQPIPTYDQDTIRGFARVFTGWRWDCPAYLVPGACNFDTANMDGWPVENFNQSKPMRLYADQHEPGTKKVLNYPGVALPNATIPANQGGARDLKDALDNVFNHPNVGPFISKQLIQKLVTSNPSPGYVQRVAEKFNNDGRGTRGNLEAVVKAILLDPEARQTPSGQTMGKVKEPLLRLTQLWRAYDAKAPSGKVSTSSFCCPVAGSSPVHIFGQSPGESPSVFNFYSPFYAPPGEIAEAGLVAPELQLANENLHTQMGWFFRVQTFYRTSREVGGQGPDNFYVNIDEEMKLADDVDALLDRVSEKLLGSKDAMSPALRREARAQLRRWVIDPNYPTNLATSRPLHHGNTRQNRISDALYLIVTSPDFVVQR